MKKLHIYLAAIVTTAVLLMTAAGSSFADQQFANRQFVWPQKNSGIHHGRMMPSEAHHAVRGARRNRDDSFDNLNR